MTESVTTNLIEIEYVTAEEDGFDYPSYSKIGRILVTVGPTDSTVYEHDYDVHDFDLDSSVFYINEGMRFDYWFDKHVEFPSDGTFVIEGVCGEYVRGDGWMTDDDEDWDYKEVRLATPEEIKTQVLP